jgi:hypothetical protein
MNKNKVQKILDRLSSFDEQTSKSLTSFEKEVDLLSKKVKEEVTLKTLDSVNAEISKLRKLFDLSPVLSSVKEMKKEFGKMGSEMGEEMASQYTEVCDKIDSTLQKIDSANEKLSSLSKFFSTIESRISSIEGSNSVKNIEKKVDDITSRISGDHESFVKDITSIKKTSSTFKKEIDDKIIKTSKDSEEAKKLIEEFRLDILNKIANIGGGSMNRQILIGGVNYLTRYTDLNFIAGAGITITAANDDTNRRVNLTIISSGSSSFETPVGTVDDSNLTFTVSNTPKYIIVNGAQYVVGTGLYASYSAPTITLTSAVGTGGFIRSAY